MDCPAGQNRTTPCTLQNVELSNSIAADGVTTPAGLVTVPNGTAFK